MKLHIELHRLDLAEVVITPPWWQRWLFAQTERTRFAARTAACIWFYDDGSRVDTSLATCLELTRLRVWMERTRDARTMN